MAASIAGVPCVRLDASTRAASPTGVSAVTGSSLYRKASFLLDSIGKPVFSPMVTLREQPFPAFTEDGLLRVLVETDQAEQALTWLRADPR